ERTHRDGRTGQPRGDSVPGAARAGRHTVRLGDRQQCTRAASGHCWHNGHGAWHRRYRLRAAAWRAGADCAGRCARRRARPHQWRAGGEPHGSRRTARGGAMSNEHSPRDAAPHGPAGTDHGATPAQARMDAVGGGLSGVAIRRPIFTLMMMMGLIVLGFFSYNRLPIDQFPDVEIPVVAVQTIYPGASPETIEREVTRRMEEAFNPVEGVDRITSNSLEGASLIIIEFELGRDNDQAAQDIRARIEAIRRNLPQGIEEPIVSKFDFSAQPILSLALASNTLSVPELTRLADEEIRRAIETVSGVGNVDVAGGLLREVRVFVDPTQLDAYGISTAEVIAALQRQNMEIPAGRVERGVSEELVRVTGRIQDAREFENVIVATRNGLPIRLSQV